MNNITSLLDEKPDLFDGSGLFSHFYDLWKNSHIPLVELAVEFGKACTKSVYSLPHVISKFPYRRELSNVKNVSEVLTLEKNTWALISTIYHDRFETECRDPNAEYGDLSQFNHSEKEIIRLLYERDNELREAQLLIDWSERLVREQIEQVAEKYECLFNETLAWENTAHLLSYLPEESLKDRNLVTELHPDAAALTHGQLDRKDEMDNERYLNYLFLCVRAGDLHRAQLLCAQRGEFWRAVSLEGWRPFHYSGFLGIRSDNSDQSVYCDRSGKLGKSVEQRIKRGGLQVNDHSEDSQVESDYDDDYMMDDQCKRIDTITPFDENVQIQGNPTRILYKSVGWWNAENATLCKFERAIYATLSGNLNVLAQVLPNSWLDQTWAHSRAFVEARVDSCLRALLDTGDRADTLAVTGRSYRDWPLGNGLSVPDSAWDPADWTIAEVFSRVDARLGWSATAYLEQFSGVIMKSVRCSAMQEFLMDNDSLVSTNDECDLQSTSVYVILYCIFYALQQAVMLRNYEVFLPTLANVMPRLVSSALGCELTPNEIGQLKPPKLNQTTNVDLVIFHSLRFLTHFVLFLKSAEPNIQDEPCAEIVKAYISLLMIDNKHPDIIVYYTSKLPTESTRIQWYSWFLAEISQAVDREKYLSLAVSHGFDLRRLTRAIVKLLRQRQLSHSNDPHGYFSSEYFGNQRLPSAERELTDEYAGKLSDTDRKHIVALDWLFYDPAQRGEALIVANSLLRLFIALRSLPSAKQVLSKLPPGILEQSKLICEKSGSPSWLVNTIHEYECLILYLESRDAFADWFQQIHSNKPVAPVLSSASSVAGSYGPRGLTQRLVVEESRKAYEAKLERWRHDVRLDTETAANKLLTLLTYPDPGWLVDFDPSTQKADAVNLFDPVTSIMEEPTINQSAMMTHTHEQLSEANHPHYSDVNDLVGLSETARARQSQLSVLRETCLTETVFLIIRLYQTAGLHERCIRLVNLVMDNGQNLYALFTTAQLQKLIHHFSESVQNMIDNERDPLGYSS